VPLELVKCRHKAVRLIHLYQFKFAEYFANFSQFFFQKIWQMVLNGQVNASKQNEKVVQVVIRYLSEMSTFPDLIEFFRGIMLQLFTLLIVPNISITEDDLEEYEMEPE
jgi:hypothetical protein